MEINRENYEMILFDLLEGNLSEKERQDALAQIEADSFLSEEWEMMQKTILPVEEIVFEDKDSLLKSESKKIAFPMWRVAAAIVFLAMFSFMVYFYSGKSGDSVNPDELVVAPDQLNHSDSSNTEIIQEQKIREIEIPEEAVVVQPANSYKRTVVNTPTKIQEELNKDSTPVQVYDAPKLIENDLEEQILVNLDQGTKVDENLNVKKGIDNKIGEPGDTIIQYASNTPDETKTDKSLRGKANNALSYLRLPKVKLSKKKGTKKSFKLELKHDKYNVITSIN
jgi:hypothetical protein